MQTQTNTHQAQSEQIYTYLLNRRLTNRAAAKQYHADKKMEKELAKASEKKEAKNKK